MGQFIDASATIGEAVIDPIQMTWGLHRPRWSRGARPESNPATSGPTADGWSIDVPSVLAMLAAVQSGHGTAADVSDGILAIIAEAVPHGCCLDCEAEVDAYQQALQEYEQARVDLHRRQAGMTEESHPFTVTRNASVHVYNCPAAPTEELIHPGDTLSEFTHGKIIDGERVSHPYSEYESTNQVRRVSGDELAGWIRARRGPKGGDNFRRCRRCQPALPVAYVSESADVG